MSMVQIQPRHEAHARQCRMGPDRWTLPPQRRRLNPARTRLTFPNPSPPPQAPCPVSPPAGGTAPTPPPMPTASHYDPTVWGRLSTTTTSQRDDAGHIIPGSGEIIPCDCCGRGISIHVRIANADTMQSATIGERCANRAGLRHLQYLTQRGDRYLRWRDTLHHRPLP